MINELAKKIGVQADNVTLLIGKIFIYAFIYVAYLFIAGVTNPDFFGEVAFLIFIVKGVPLATLGICQGYIYLNFRSERDYTREYFYFYCLIFCILIILMLVLGRFEFVILSLCVFPLQIVEPYFRVQRKFFVSHYPELVLIASFLVVTLVPFEIAHLSQAALAASVLAILFTGAVFFTLDRQLLFDFFRKVLRGSFDVKFTFRVIRTGFASYLITLGYYAFLFLDRSGVEHQYDGANLGSLMLAFQLAIGAGIFATILNVTALVDVGSLLEKDIGVLKGYLVRRLIIIGTVNVASFSSVLLFVWVFGGIFNEYENLLYLTFIVGLSMLFYNIYGVFSPIAFYFRRQKLVILFFAVPILVMSILDLFGVTGSFLVRETVVYSSFAVAMLGSLMYSVLLLSRESRRNSELSV